MTVASDTTQVVYTAKDALISGNGDPFHKVLNIRLDHYQREGMTTLIRTENSITEAPDDERKKLIESHASVLTDVLKAAETTKLNSAIKRERMEQEIAAQERADRITMMFAVNNAIQAGLSEEEVTADMCDGWASYVCDMYGHVYTATDLDTVVNSK